MDAKSLKIKRIKAFLEISARDMKSAKILASECLEHAAFLVKQSAEKLLRAVLEHEQIVSSRTHSLRELASLLPVDHAWREPFFALDRVSLGNTLSIPDFDRQHHVHQCR
jgi:HEPN domain-containing protein